MKMKMVHKDQFKCRKKNMIVSGGENIYPAEVERVLYTHPAIAETAVIGIPDEKWQEVPVAVVALKPGLSATGEELRAFLEGELARYKVPREIVFLDTLPRNPTGKVLKRVLAERG